MVATVTGTSATAAGSPEVANSLASQLSGLGFEVEIEDSARFADY
jgi:menaquinone-dependent protoporphyrinogen IX oxidase